MIPVWNGARFLGATLESVLAQTLPAREIIVVDDGSTDAGLEVARSYAERFPTLRVLAGENGGVATARNRGVTASQGEWLTFLDQDDLWPPNVLESHARHGAAHPDAEVIYGKQRMFLSPGAIRPACIKPELLENDYPSYTLGAMLIRRQLFAHIGLFDPKFAMGSDSDWLARARDRGAKFSASETVTLLKRAHEANHSHDTGTAHRELALLLKASLDRRRTQGGTQ